MGEQAPVADLPYEAQQRGHAAGLIVSGAVALVVLLAVGGDLLGVVLVACIMSAGMGLGSLFGRERTQRELLKVPRAAQPRRRDPGRGFARGLRPAMVMAAFCVAGFTLVARGDPAQMSIIPGFLLGFGIGSLLDVRDLHRWQDAHGVELFTRPEARAFRLVQLRDSDRLVAVGLEPSGARREPA